ncbi:YkvA family protein [Neisseriaceae bacterium CLB008]|nr:DUF1232 domain-containing protein [Neisseriaceae bacterium]
MTSTHQSYDDERFWRKVQRYAVKMGEVVLDPALRLYYAAKDQDTPKWARATIYGALAYFILPVDAIPDVLPGVGYSDDLSVLMAALATTAAYVKAEHIAEAQRQLQKWFHGGAVD